MKKATLRVAFGAVREPGRIQLPGVQRGWMIRSGKKRKTSIVMPAVRVNQIAATTGAVERNFFMALGISGGKR